MHHSPVITIKRITRIVTSAGVLYFAKSGVNTPMSSPPLDMVTADTKSNDKCSVFKNCFFFIGASCNSNNLLTPRIIGIKPIRPKQIKELPKRERQQMMRSIQALLFQETVQG